MNVHIFKKLVINPNICNGSCTIMGAFRVLNYGSSKQEPNTLKLTTPMTPLGVNCNSFFRSEKRML